MIKEEIEIWINDTVANDVFETFDNQRNRLEHRFTAVYDYNSIAQDIPDEWELHLKQIVRVTRHRGVLTTKISEIKYSEDDCLYISTCFRTAEEYSKIIRSHWHIENKNHYVRDDSYREDYSRIRKKPQWIAILRSLSMNLLRITWSTNIASDRKKMSMSLENLLNRFKIYLT